MNHHLFISHASEDKDAFVRPLAKKLQEAGVLVWFDEFSVTTGDSLRESIDKGLVDSRYGLVILSKNFFKKRWAKKELNALFAREMSQQSKVILPVWYNISHSDVLEKSPLLADVLAITHRGDINSTVKEVCNVLRMHDLYSQLAGEQSVKLLSNDGAEASWILRRTVQVNKLPLETMSVRVSAEGARNLESVTPGSFDKYANISGTRVAVIKYAPPIPPGTVFTQELVFSCKDMYCEAENAASLVPTLPYEKYILSVKVLDPLAISNVRVIKSVGGQHHDIGGLEVSQDKRQYKVRLENPAVGYLHMLLWDKGR